MTWAQLIRQALLVSNLAPRGQDVDPTLNADALDALRLMLSKWSRDGILEPAYMWVEAQLTAGTNEYSAGAGQLFNKRPLQIHQAILYGGGLGNVRLPIRVTPWPVYQAQTYPSAQGQPSDCFYNPTYPIGTFAFYPTPSQSWSVRILGTFDWLEIDTLEQVSVPPGYADAIIDNLAVKIAENYMVAVRPELANRARDGVASIKIQIPPKDATWGNAAITTQRSGLWNFANDRPT